MHYDSDQKANKCTMTCDSCWSGPAAGTLNSQVYTCQAEEKHDVGHFDPPTKDALQCIKVSCGPLPPQDPNSIAVHWDGTEKECSEEPPEKDPDRDFSAKCNPGWTGGQSVYERTRSWHADGNVQNREAHISCQADGTYSAGLTCIKVPCHVPWLLPASGDPIPRSGNTQKNTHGLGCDPAPWNGKCPSNVVIPPE